MLDEPDHPRLRRYRNRHTKDWSAIVHAADAFVFVFVTPKYNHGDPAALKLLVIVPAAAAGTWTLRRRGAVDLGASLRTGAFGVAVAVAGSLIALAVPSHSLRLVFAGAVG
jgi:NAD(P)H-dependent FMN reductase